MKNLSEQTARIHVFRRGVDVSIHGARLSPEQLTAKMELVSLAGTLKSRFPDPQSGEGFMTQVDPDRGETLKGYATELTEEIVSSWQNIAPEKPIAVVLFGSVARGLVKSQMHTDPSNIDLSVMGDINEEEREKLFDLIRPQRVSTQEKILKDCPDVQTGELNPGNAGVHIQHVDKLRKNGFHSTLYWYIASSAQALHDPDNVWGQLESDALDYYIKNKRRKWPREHTEYVVYDLGKV